MILTRKAACETSLSLLCVPGSPRIVLLSAVRLCLHGGLSLYLLCPTGDQREDPGGDLQRV